MFIYDDIIYVYMYFISLYMYVYTYLEELTLCAKPYRLTWNFYDRDLLFHDGAFFIYYY